jgi:tetratricopeptide (TPR) repeat protein
MARHMPKRLLLLLTLFAALLALARDKAENWLEVRSPHFIVLSNSSEKQARHVADQFERMRGVFHERFPRASIDPTTPIVVLAIKDQKDFRVLEPEAYLGKGKLEIAGFFLRAPDKNYVAMRLDAPGEHPYAVIYHEYTHLLNSKAEHGMPLWLNEGLAEFYQTTEIRDKEVLVGNPSAENRMVLLQNPLLPLPILLTVDGTSPYYHEENKGSIFYAESWALTHYLTVKDDHENTYRLTDYATLVSEGMDSVTAATRAFGDLKLLQAALEKYIRQGAYYYSKKPASIDVDDSAFKVQALSPAQADATRADFLAYSDRVADARSLLDEVLHGDPQNALAHETMGYLEFRQGHLDAARKWYEQAVGLDSQSFLAHYYFAAISMNQGELTADAEPRVESSLRTAIKLNPSFAPSYDQLAVFYGMRRRNLEEAHTLCLTAVQLDPGNLHYRLNTANILMQMERGTDAVAVLRNARSLAKTPADVASVQNLLDTAQQYQSAREQMGQEQQSAPAIQSSVSNEQSLAPATSGNTKPVTSDQPPGLRRGVKGMIKDVRCSRPAIMELTVEGDGKTLSLRSNNYFKIQFTARGFTPAGELHPCTDLEGMKARVEFSEPLGISAEGQISSIELSK